MKSSLLLPLILLACLGCRPDSPSASGDDGWNKWGTRPQTRWNPEIKKFSSCQEIQDYLQSFRVPQEDSGLYDGGDDASPSQGYENQVAGVFEGDILQMSPRFFFFVRPGSIEIAARTSLEKQKSIPLNPVQKQWLLYADKKLIYVGGDYSKTVIKIYDETKDFQLIYEKTQVGAPMEFRLVQNRLTVLSRSYSFTAGAGVACTQIYKPNLENGSEWMTYLSTLEIGPNTVLEETQGFLGYFDFFYMTQDELFLFSHAYGFSSYFRVLDLRAKTPELRQVQTYPGTVKDRWAVTKKNKALLFATAFRDSDYRNNNKLLVYSPDKKGDYRASAESPSFGRNEDIRAIRYLDDKAYVVTFEKTDPLFILNIKNPQNIQILSELQSPGFSTQLRDLRNGKMGGLGYQAVPENGFSWFDGLKFSLFDLSNPLVPKEVDVLKWGDRGSYSEATSEPKALFISADKERVIFPSVIVEKAKDTQPWAVGTDLQFAGVLILDFDGSQVREKGRVSHQEWRESICGAKAYFPIAWWDMENISSDIQRAVQLEGKIYTFSRFGMMSSSAKDLQTAQMLEFENTKALCQK